MEPALLILLIVFVLIAVRQVGGLRFRIWQVMLFGAIAVLVTGQISLVDAARSINLDVMIFLLGMFIVGEALSESGYLFSLSRHLLKRSGSFDRFIFIFIFLTGIFSALLMNDTLAIICTPLALFYSRKFGVDPKILLLALCFAVTTGSVMSPIGNPQNLLVATESGYTNPFFVFLMYLGIPTFVSLMAVYLCIRVMYRGEVRKEIPSGNDFLVPDPELARISKISLVLVLTVIGLQVFFSFQPAGITFSIPLPVIAIAGAAPIVLFSRKRIPLLKKIDWPTLVFFASMFVLMAAVYSTGFFQAAVPAAAASSIPLLFTTSVIISQFISNVPYVALFTPLMIQSGLTVNETLALAAGSTIAGNLTILGAASNVIVIQQAERQGTTLTFTEFLKPGILITLVTSCIYILWLSIV